MPHKVKRTRTYRPFYLIPVAFGMTGVLFSNQLEDPILQGIVVLFCLAVPLFVGGNVLGRIRSDGLQRVLLFASLIALAIGAVVVVSGLSDRLVPFEYVSPRVGQWSNRLGMASLLLGLLAAIYSMVRSEAIIDQVVDRFRHVANHIGEGFLLLDQDGKIVLVNRSVLSTTGIEEEELIGQSLWDIAKRYDIDSVDLGRKESMRLTPRTFEFTWKRHGEDRHYQITDTPIYDRKRHKEGNLFIIRDITEQYRLSSRLELYTKDLHDLVDEQTKRLRDSKERQSDLLMQMNEGFLTADENCMVYFANVHIARILKLNIEQLEGRNLIEFVPGDERSRLMSALDSISKGTRGAASQEYKFMRDDGAYVPVKIAIAKARGKGHELDHYSLVVTDLQELKDMQYELEKHATQLETANAELREMDLAKDTLLSNVSHELRTPLATIEGYVEMFQTGTLGAVEGPQVGALRIIKRNLERLSVLIHEMIEFSRMEIRGIILYETVFDLNKFVEESVLSAHPGANQKEIKINTVTDDTGLSIWGDHDKLSQVLGILLSNAVKFSHEDSSIDVSIRSTDSKDIEISIQDYGIGIEKKNLERIFQKFYQVDSSMTRHFEGTGIGLSIAANIVEGHGGRIDVESELNSGTTFRVHLPDAVFGWAHIDEKLLSLEGTLIYVVNSNIEFRDSCSRLLRAMGATVQEYHSGYESFRHAQEDDPDLVLFGETLPDVSGVQALNLFSTDPGTQKIKLLLMMTRSPKDGESTSLDRAHVLWKPFSSYDLVQQVRSRVLNQEKQSEVS